jgi:hypothetical protein
MGLFGMKLFGYNEKNYKKNSEDFKGRLESIMLNSVGRGVNNFGINKALTRLMVLIDTLPYYKDGKDYEKIDSIINEILGKMEDDVREKRMASVVVRADLLYRELDEGRRYGKSAFNDKERDAEHGKAEALGRIHSELERQERIVKEQEFVLDQAAKVSDVERQKYRLKYNSLEAEKKETERLINMWQTKYDLALEVIGARNTASQLGAFESTKIANLKDFEKEMSDVTNRLDKAITETTEMMGVAKGAIGDMNTILGGAATTDSAFDSLVEDKKNANLMKDMGSAPSAANTSSQEDDAFAKAMSKR